jgi:PAS domain S-box-containing protein
MNLEPTQATILIVDDTPDDLRLLSHILKKQGYIVHAFDEGSEALEVVEQIQPDLILLDVMMPGMDGYTLCEHLKAKETIHDKPVIFISALDHVQSKVKGFRLGGVDFITKPFQREEIQARIATHLALQRMQQELVENNTRLQQEITERQRVELALRQSEAALQQVNTQLEQRVAEQTANLRLAQFALDQAGDGIFWAQHDGQFVYVNDAACRKLGYTRDELLTMKVWDIDAQLTPEEWNQCWEGRQEHTFRHETIHRTKDGRTFPVEVSLSFIIAGEQEYLYAFAQDITERKQAEDALRQSEAALQAANRQLEQRVQERTAALRESQALLHTVLEHSPAFIFVYDLDGRYMLINRSGANLFGLAPEEIIGKTGDELVAAEHVERWREEDRQVIAAKTAIAFEQSYQHHDNSYTHLLMKFPLLNDQNEVYAIGGVITDITKRKQDEQELQRAKEAAEAANRAKSTFLANMSHELRTPLNAILGFTQLLVQDGDVPYEQQESLQIIERSGEHLLALINDILEMSKIEAGRAKLTEKECTLNVLLHDLIAMFQLRAEKKGVSLSLSKSAYTPGYIFVDESKLRQILINLLGNAIKFTDKGSVTLQVTSDMSEPLPPDSVVLLHFHVQDTGPGIVEEEQSTLFDAFTQTATGIAKQEGTGLGLSICNHYVQMMGGSITMQSQPGHGSTFSFSIPVQVISPDRVETTSTPRKITGIANHQPHWRILIVEDRDHNRLLLLHILERLGFEVLVAMNGKKAVEQWETWHPQLIFMDMRMPVMDGYEATRQIRLKQATSSLAAPYIIALTAATFEEDQRNMLDAGCDACIRKPFTTEDIYQVLRDYLAVRFVYEDAQQQKSSIESASGRHNTPLPPLPTESLQVLPAWWLKELHYAAVLGNVFLVEELTGQIHEEYHALAELINQYVWDFQFEQIVVAIEPLI